MQFYQFSIEKNVESLCFNFICKLDCSALVARVVPNTVKNVVLVLPAATTLLHGPELVVAAEVEILKALCVLVLTLGVLYIVGKVFPYNWATFQTIKTANNRKKQNLEICE